MIEESKVDLLNRFYKKFEDDQKEIESTPPESPDASRLLNDLRKSLQNVESDLPSHDKASYQEKIKLLETRFSSKRRSKFAFRRTANATVYTASKPQVLDMVPVEPAQTPIQSRKYFTSIADGSSISHHTRSIVNLSSTASLPNFQCANMTDCLIVLPRILSSVIITEVKGCIIAIPDGCQQFRLGSSRDTTVLLTHPPNGPLKPSIDMCHGITFAYLDKLETKLDGVDIERAEIQDFSHLTGGVSRNFTVASNEASQNLLGRVRHITAELTDSMTSIEHSDIQLRLQRLLPTK